MNQGEKTSWPELNGKNVDEAVQQIKEENPELKVFKVPLGSMVTMDYRTDRVRVYYDEATKLVQREPHCGWLNKLETLKNIRNKITLTN